MAENEISVGEFVSRLFEIRFRAAADNILRYGHYRGWLEDQDERHPEAPLNRQSAARIVHQFLRIECNLQDIEDITPATILKDLYNCRVCANHIAQIYLRGIMKAMEYQADNQTVQIFNHLETISQHEAEEILTNISRTLSQVPC